MQSEIPELKMLVCGPKLFAKLINFFARGILLSASRSLPIVVGADKVLMSRVYKVARNRLMPELAINGVQSLVV